MREENFWCKKPRYSEVRVITRRVIARHDCISKTAEYNLVRKSDVTFFIDSVLDYIKDWGI